MYTRHTKCKLILCLNLGSYILLMHMNIHTDIPRSEILQVPSILDKGYSTYTMKQKKKNELLTLMKMDEDENYDTNTDKNSTHSILLFKSGSRQCKLIFNVWDSGCRQ